MAVAQESTDAARPETVAPPVAGVADGATPWYERLASWAGIAVVAACVLFLVSQVQPRLVLSNTTIAGGDTGAHVWFPAYLRDHLLPWHLAGWTSDYYAGFPAGQFYFPFPAVLIVVLGGILPYNVAFKLVTVLGLLALPPGAYVFGRGIRAPRPAPALMAVTATAFLFLKNAPNSTIQFDLRIMGGTMAATYAGEFSFMIALAAALFFLGTFARALEDRGPRWLPAVILAVVVTSHLVVAIFAVLGALVIWASRRPWRTAARAAAIGVVGFLLTAVWLLPLAANLGYTTDMRYEPIGTGTGPGYLRWMFLHGNWYLYPLALAALLAGGWFRRRATLDLALLTLVTGVVFYNWEGLRNVFGKAPAWNLRLLPFWYLSLFLLAGLGAAEIVRFVARTAGWLADGGTDPARRLFQDTDALAHVGAGPAPVAPETVAPDTVAHEAVAREAVAPETVAPETVVPETVAPDTLAPETVAPRTVAPDAATAAPPTRAARRRARSRVGALTEAVAVTVLVAVLATLVLVRLDDTSDFLPYWAKYNYSGYEGGTVAAQTKKSWPEYKAFIDTVAALPAGRLAWETGTSSDVGNYGTPLAMMLLPYWTHGRISSMEGLYYEASATTPYHFMAIATLAQSPSDPVRGIPYRSVADFDLGVRYLQVLGVRYYAAFTPTTKAAAAKNPSLRLVVTVPDLDGKPPDGWNIYEVRDSTTVAPLRYEPVVVKDLHADPNWKCEGKPRPPTYGTSPAELSAWECAAVPWFDDPVALDRPLTDGGPSSWARASVANARATVRRSLPPVSVTHVRSTETTVDFDVSRTGVPVMVKSSYYPSWTVDGARGPWRATPDFMVVVPTSRHVHLAVGTPPVEWAGRVLTLVGVGGVVALAWRGAAGAGTAGEPDRRRWVRFPSRPRR